MTDTNINKTTAVKVGDIPDYNADHDYFAITIKGDCLNNDQSPMVIKDGDLLLCHRINRRVFISNWHTYKDRIVLVEPFTRFAPYVKQTSGNHYIFGGDVQSGLVKQFVGIEHGFFAVLRMFNPPTTLSVNLDEIKEISIIDKVLEP